jgi:hypothetical protein
MHAPVVDATTRCSLSVGMHKTLTRALVCAHAPHDDAEDDWVKASIAASDRAFHESREAAKSVRTSVWEEEARVRREEEFAESARRESQAVAVEPAAVQFMITQRMRASLAELGYSEADVDRLEPQRAATIIQAATQAPGKRQAMGGGGGAAMSSEEQAGQNLHEYEARMRDLARARPMTEEAKREAYDRDLLAQIEQADAMDERLAQQNRAAEFHKRFRQQRGLD